MLYIIVLIVQYKEYDYYMGYNAQGKIATACSGEGTNSSFARVFTQDSFKFADLSCIQFGYFMEGQTEVTLGLYIDTTGGDPDWESMELIGEVVVTTINAVGQFQVQTVTFPDAVPVAFSNTEETLVLVMTVPVMSEGFILGGGAANEDVVNTPGNLFTELVNFAFIFSFIKVRLSLEVVAGLISNHILILRTITAMQSMPTTNGM